MALHLGFSPWISMWTSPKRTIQAIVEEKSFWPIIVLSVLFGLQYGFVYIYQFTLFIGLKTIFWQFVRYVLSIVLSGIFGFLYIMFFSWMLFLAGRFLDGQAGYSQMVKTFAWSMLPSFLVAISWLIVLVFSSQAFYSLLKGHSLFFLGLIYLVATFWSLILLFASLQQVQEFSLLRAVVNFLMAAALFAIIIFLTIALYYLFMHFGK